MPTIADLSAAADESEAFATRSHQTELNLYQQSIKPIIDARRADIFDTQPQVKGCDPPVSLRAYGCLMLSRTGG
jgi:hypothetical protein